MADMDTCACPGCEHEVTREQAVLSEGQVYCCDACAAGHPKGMECIQPGCGCTELNRTAPD